MRSTLLLASVLLAGCASRAPLPSGPGAFACPPAGTVVRFDREPSHHWLGADPGDPTLCLRRNGASGNPYRVTTVFFTSNTGSLFDAARAEIPTLWPPRVGAEVDFSGVLETAGAVGPVGSSRFRNVVRVDGEGTVVVGGTPRPVWLMSRSATSTHFGGRPQVTRLAVDKATNAVLRNDFTRYVNGEERAEPTRTAVSIEVPAAP